MYEMIWRNKFLTTECKTIEEMIANLRGAADQLEAMAKDGVTLEVDERIEDDYAALTTDDPKVAKKYKKHGMVKV